MTFKTGQTVREIAIGYPATVKVFESLGINRCGGKHPLKEACEHGLSGFECDLHRHIHWENNILFPRVIGMEKQLAGAGHVGC